MHAALQSISHRPWPLPSSPWIMAQTWHDLLFMHWPISPQTMRALVPAQLPLDVFNGQCWLGIAPFWMSGVRARGMPALPGLSRFPELNVRTYVTLGDKPGVYFFSLDAANLAAVWAAHAFYHLPYFFASMKSEIAGDEITYTSRRRNGAAEFRGRYGPSAPVRLRERGTLEHWLSERYCLYTVHQGQVFRGEIHHKPWPLQDAGADITVNTMAAAASVPLPERPPLLHFSKRLDVLIWPLQRATASL